MEKLALLIAGEIALSKDPGNTMRKWREIFGVSQTELAEHLGISPSTISDYESGRRKSPGIGVVRRLVEALFEIDRKRGGKVLSQLLKRWGGPETEPFEVHDFTTPLPAMEFVRRINGTVITHPSLLEERKVYGYTLIDSLRAIVELPVHEYLKMFGSTPQRALIFLGVTTGRSPMISIKIGKFSTQMVPEIVVLHGITQVDPLAVKIAEKEGVSLITTLMSPKLIVNTFREYEE